MADDNEEMSVRQDDSGSASQGRTAAPQSGPKALIEQFTGMMMRVGPAPNPILDKITSDQIGTVIKNKGDEDKRRHERLKGREITLRLAIAAVCLFVIGLCWLFLKYDKSEHLEGVIGVIIGAFGGYGFGSRKSAE